MKKFGDESEVHSISMLMIIDLLLRTDGMLRLYDMLNQYVYDVIEHTERVEVDKATFEAALNDPEKQNDKAHINRLAGRIKSNEDNYCGTRWRTKRVI